MRARRRPRWLTPRATSGALDALGVRDRADERDDEQRDKEQEHDREQGRDVEDRRTLRLGEDALERPHQRLGRAVQRGDERLVRVRSEELEGEAQEQQHFEDREDERHDNRRGPYRCRTSGCDIDVRGSGRGRHRSLAYLLVALDTFDAFGWVVVVLSCCHVSRRQQGACQAANLPSVEAFAFRHRQRVRFGETDMQNVVYYANYLLYAEVGRVAYLRELGLLYGDIVAKGLDFTIGEARVRYRAPLRFDEEFDIKVRVGEIRQSSWAFEYAVDRADGLRCAEMTTVQVMIDRSSFRPKRIPEDLQEPRERANGPRSARPTA